MACYNIYFSPTGGTKKVAALVANGLADTVSDVDLTDNRTDFQLPALSADDEVVIAVPSYSGRVPSPAVDRIARLQGNGAKAVLVCVYGNRAYEDTLVELRDVVVNGGFRVVAAVAAVAEHSIARRYAAGRPDADDCRQLTAFAVKIRERLSSGSVGEPAIPGNRPYRKAGKVGFVPKPTRKCNKCGACARKCPVGAIDAADYGKVDRDKCISCMRCVAVCPHKGRKVSPVMLFAANLMLKKACSIRKENELFL